jgi:hypothetical protein
MLRRVALVRTDISEELSGELGTTNVVPSSPILVTLTMKRLSSTEISVLTSATRRNIPEDTILHSHCCEHLKSYMFSKYFSTLFYYSFPSQSSPLPTFSFSLSSLLILFLSILSPFSSFSYSSCPYATSTHIPFLLFCNVVGSGTMVQVGRSRV